MRTTARRSESRPLSRFPDGDGMSRAWTLGTPRAYDIAVRMPGNQKAPGGYVFQTREEAAAYAASHDLAFAPYEIELPRSYHRSTTADYWKAAIARHRWHTDTTLPAGTPFMAACAVCLPRVEPALDCRLLIVAAPLINPDTGLPA